MKVMYKKMPFIILFLAMLLIVNNAVIASQYTDKLGRDVIEIIAPTAESHVDPDQISDAIRRTVISSENATDPIKNIYSESIIYDGTGESYQDYIKSLYDNKMYDVLATYGECTNIRHTVSVTNVDEDRYMLINDSASDRLRMKVIVDSIGEYYAKDGFYKVNGKTYYFDENGLMVLGPARDSSGEYYFFSYDTGELLDDNK